ncbi:hypothetical protein ACX1JO_003074 [Cronobacter dublinensis]
MTVFSSLLTLYYKTPQTAFPNLTRQQILRLRQQLILSPAPVNSKVAPKAINGKKMEW